MEVPDAAFVDGKDVWDHDNGTAEDPGEVADAAVEIRQSEAEGNGNVSGRNPLEVSLLGNIMHYTEGRLGYTQRSV